jgi:hypothetical protein
VGGFRFAAQRVDLDAQPSHLISAGLARFSNGLPIFCIATLAIARLRPLCDKRAERREDYLADGRGKDHSGS